MYADDVSTGRLSSAGSDEKPMCFGEEKMSERPRVASACCGGPPTRLQVGLYKIFFYFEAVVHESTILSSPRPSALPTVVQYYCTTIGQ